MTRFCGAYGQADGAAGKLGDLCVYFITCRGEYGVEESGYSARSLQLSLRIKALWRLQSSEGVDRAVFTRSLGASRRPEELRREVVRRRIKGRTLDYRRVCQGEANRVLRES